MTPQKQITPAPATPLLPCQTCSGWHKIAHDPCPCQCHAPPASPAATRSITPEALAEIRHAYNEYGCCLETWEAIQPWFQDLLCTAETALASPAAPSGSVHVGEWQGDTFTQRPASPAATVAPSLPLAEMECVESINGAMNTDDPFVHRSGYGVHSKSKCPACVIRTQAERVRALTEAVEEAAKDINAMADRAYCDSLDAARRTECLGWEAKVRCGQFGKPEMEAHKKSDELMGRHIGFRRAAARIQSLVGGAGEQEGGKS